MAGLLLVFLMNIVIIVVIAGFLIWVLKKSKGAGKKRLLSVAEVSFHGAPLVCKHCQHTRFSKRKGQLNTILASFFDFDFLNPEATCYICEKCGYIQWFLISEDDEF